MTISQQASATYLGLDLGTSELKALLIDADQRVLAQVGIKLDVQRPHPLWSEQHPQIWWDALVKAIDQLHQSHGSALARLASIGLSGQMHGAVLLNREGQVLRPAILWNDGRSAKQCEQLARMVPALTTITGNLAMPGFTAPKLLWLQLHEPDCFAQLGRVMLPKDWLRLQLTGDAVTDCSDAAGTLWLDTGLREWSPDMLRACQLDPSHMPSVIEGSGRAGTLLPEWRERWGIDHEVWLAAGAGDNAASAVGMGLTENGQGFVSLGTSGVVFICNDSYRPNAEQAVHTFCHAVPERWFQMSVMLSAASSLSWACGVLGFEDEQALVHSAEQSRARGAAGAPIFLPYLSGERSPLNNPWALGSWQDLNATHQRGDLAYAVVEGVGFGLLDGLRTLHGCDTIKTLSLVGGGSRSAWWAQLLADTLGVELLIQASARHAAALGAARLAMLCVGQDVNAVCQTPAIEQRYAPEPERRDKLATRYQRFKTLQASLSATFTER